MGSPGVWGEVIGPVYSLPNNQLSGRAHSPAVTVVYYCLLLPPLMGAVMEGAARRKRPKNPCLERCKNSVTLV